MAIELLMDFIALFTVLVPVMSGRRIRAYEVK
jgi:hypothetical protein